MEEINISVVFRTKINEKIYSFDIVAVSSLTLVSSLVGYCVVNLKKDNFQIGINKSIRVSNEELKEHGRMVLDEARRLEENIFS